jgi:hypothetical protein
MKPGHRAVPPLLLAAALLPLGTGCGHASARLVGGAVASSPRVTAAAAADDSGTRAFCALARDKGAADLLNLRDNPAAGRGLDKVLANLDELTAAAPTAIKGDYTRLDQLEHALLGGQPGRRQLARLDSPDTAASLRRIQRYLVGHCGIGW